MQPCENEIHTMMSIVSNIIFGRDGVGWRVDLGPSTIYSTLARVVTPQYYGSGQKLSPSYYRIVEMENGKWSDKQMRRFAVFRHCWYQRVGLDNLALPNFSFHGPVGGTPAPEEREPLWFIRSCSMILLNCSTTPSARSVGNLRNLEPETRRPVPATEYKFL